MKIPERKDVAKEHCWNLSRLYPSDAGWETGLADYKNMASRIESFRGTLGVSADGLKSCLDFMTELGMLEERLGYYVQMRHSEDGGDGRTQDMYGRYVQAAVQANAAAGYMNPEILAIPAEKMEAFMESLPEYQIPLTKLVRNRPHILSEAEEKLLALQEEANETANKAFSALTDVDMDFGSLSTPEGERPLSQSSFQAFLESPDRALRERAYSRFMGVFDAHKNTLAALLAGSVNLDMYRARVRKFPSARAAHLFPDNVPEAVYDNLISTVHKSLPALHRYYNLRRRVLGLDTLCMYDTKTPLVKDVQSRHSYEEAVEVVLSALAPLGTEYTGILRKGLLGGWVDRYENKGKHSGAFSAGSYCGDPYILLNYKDDLLRDVFTLAHEAGHSMHSYYSVQNNPFQHYNYTIFEAEVASTFNEQLLFTYLISHADSENFRAYLTGKQIDDIIATFFRQTMFAEFEHLCHASVENGKPLTLENIRAIYHKLLEEYFGPALSVAPADELEGLRIPHFYRAFYVYKYATGIAAAISLSRKVLGGAEVERSDYFSFLTSGGSRFPLESLRRAGVDMSRPEAVEDAAALFASLVDEFEKFFA
ncbi:MAG: oligoendopeptidase F [Spirochaetales bacterium]|jgi:oligoendopeptidase F|nr:oligoendopeptidase F [Spirochaetales bacterium]